jgi:hypothetical protein
VNLTPASGRRPAYAICVPHNAVSLERDTAHTGTTSQVITGAANAATGIVSGGIDQVSVGSVLNANGIIYDLFVLPGSATAGNNGWSVPGEEAPVEPDVPHGGPGTPWDDVPPDPEASPTTPAPEVEPGGDATDFGTQCITASTKIINMALSRIGISKRVGDISTEQSNEAAVARLHYSDDLSATLRDFDWAFATRYAELVLVGGTSTVPVNGDWQYSYRAPINMMKARRIVNPDGSKRNYDPNAPKFRVGSDTANLWVITTAYVTGDRVEWAGDYWVATSGSTGQTPSSASAFWTVTTTLLIFTDQANDEDPVELEYTIRPECAAATGDALFRSALAWRHASSLAPVLSLDEKKIQFCLSMYALQLGQAKTTNAQEQQQAPEGDADWITGRD